MPRRPAPKVDAPILNIAIVGGGPTAVYTLAGLVSCKRPLAITIFEKGRTIGAGMPYSAEMVTGSMLSNIASHEIPPLRQSLAEWLASLDVRTLAEMGLAANAIDPAEYYPRLTLGRYYLAQLSQLVSVARGHGHRVELKRRTEVRDICPCAAGIALHWTAPDDQGEAIFDEVVIATGHLWSKAEDTALDTVPLWPICDVEALEADRIGILGSSLSAIDAAVAISEIHGVFSEAKALSWQRKEGHIIPKITMLSRKGLLPEADFYYPWPLPELPSLSQARLDAEIEQGQSGLLARLFEIFVADLRQVAPIFTASLGFDKLTLELFAQAYFADRLAADPFDWARRNLAEAQLGHEVQRACPGQVAILVAHELFESAAPYLEAEDLGRLKSKLAPVFADNYASVPHRSIERLLAMHDAGVLDIVALGEEYHIVASPEGYRLTHDAGELAFDEIIDARGQRALTVNDLRFPSLILGKTVRNVDHGAGLHLIPLMPSPGFIQCLSLPVLLPRRPFVQGLVQSAELGAAAARSINERAIEPSPGGAQGN